MQCYSGNYPVHPANPRTRSIKVPQIQDFKERVETLNIDYRIAAVKFLVKRRFSNAYIHYFSSTTYYVNLQKTTRIRHILIPIFSNHSRGTVHCFANASSPTLAPTATAGHAFHIKPNPPALLDKLPGTLPNF